jgi:hypothetical protein
MTSRTSIGDRLWHAAAVLALLVGGGLGAPQIIPPAMAQATPPAAVPAAPPPWTQGRPPEFANSPLHPHIPSLIGTPAKDIPIGNAKLPPGFKIEIWAADLQEVRSMALGAKGTVFVGNRLRDEVMAVVDRGDHREVKHIAKGLAAPNGVALVTARSMSPNANGSFASTTSRTSPTSRRSLKWSSMGCRSNRATSGNS